MVTPKIIKVLYVLFTIWTALVGLIILVIGFRTGGMAGGLFTLIIVEPIFLLLTLGIYRVVLEAFMVIFRIYDEMKKIRENTETRRADAARFSARRASTAAAGLSTARTPSVRGLTGSGCPQPSGPGEGVFHSSGPVTHMVIHRRPGVRYLSRGTESPQRLDRPTGTGETRWQAGQDIKS